MLFKFNILRHLYLNSFNPYIHHYFHTLQKTSRLPKIRLQNRNTFTSSSAINLPIVTRWIKTTCQKIAHIQNVQQTQRWCFLQGTSKITRSDNIWRWNYGILDKDLKTGWIQPLGVKNWVHQTFFLELINERSQRCDLKGRTWKRRKDVSHWRNPEHAYERQQENEPGQKPDAGFFQQIFHSSQFTPIGQDQVRVRCDLQQSVQLAVQRQDGGPVWYWSCADHDESARQRWLRYCMESDSYNSEHISSWIEDWSTRRISTSVLVITDKWWNCG